CLRLAAGMLACLPLLPAAEAHPRYYRTHFLTALGLALLAGLALWGGPHAGVLALCGVAALVSVAGAAVYNLEGAPGGRLLTLLDVGLLAAALLWLDAATPPAPGRPAGPHVAANLSSAALLGAALSAMLMGHYYLIAPAMSLRPLMRLFGALAAA